MFTITTLSTIITIVTTMTIFRLLFGIILGTIYGSCWDNGKRKWKLLLLLVPFLLV